jgi:hypothetical protein
MGLLHPSLSTAKENAIGDASKLEDSMDANNV